MNLPKITAMYRVKNEERWIEKSIQSVLDICSTIVVLDDGSSDSTLEICKSFDNVIVQSQSNLPLDESRDRNTTLKMALEKKPDYIFTIDGDEILAPNSYDIFLDELSVLYPKIDVFEFQILYMWDKPNQVRYDGIFSRTWQKRLVNLKNQPELIFENTPYPGNLHCGGIPTNTNGQEKLYKDIGSPSIIIHTVVLDILKINQDKHVSYETNILGTQNVCEIVSKNPSIKGIILTSSWHVFGEQELGGRINESFGYRPDKVEDRARLYAISKILQECIIRFFDEMYQKKYFGAIRLGTVLAEDMRDGISAKLFINQALSGKEITPFKHSMHRPMLFVTVEDVCKAFKSFIELILNNEKEQKNSLEHIFNLAYPKPISILDLAQIIKESIQKHSGGKISPVISIVDKDLPELFTSDDKNKIHLDTTHIQQFLKIDELIEPKKYIDELIKKEFNLRINNNSKNS